MGTRPFEYPTDLFSTYELEIRSNEVAQPQKIRRSSEIVKGSFGFPWNWVYQLQRGPNPCSYLSIVLIWLELKANWKGTDGNILLRFAMYCKFSREISGKQLSIRKVRFFMNLIISLFFVLFIYLRKLLLAALSYKHINTKFNFIQTDRQTRTHKGMHGKQLLS